MKKFLFLLLMSFSKLSAQTGAGNEYPDGHGDVVFFPMGDLSFADEVISFSEGTPAAKASLYRNSKDILGAPDINLENASNCLTLGCKGSIVLHFKDNALSDVKGPDLYVFEIGPAVEPTSLSISEDGNTWIDIGKISGGRADIDIAPFIKPDQIFYYVKLTDLGNDCEGDWPGADIDAVGTIGSVMHIALNSSLLFDQSKHDLKPEAKKELDAAAIQIKSCYMPGITIEGHTDNVGNKDLNQKLSEQRALEVKNYLVKEHSIDASLIKIVGYGGTRPLYPNDVEENKKKNRRVSIIVKPTEQGRKLSMLYAIYDKNADMTDKGYPHSFNNDFFPGVWKNAFDDAVSAGDGKIYFFKGKEFISFDKATMKSDAGYPQPVNKKSWPGLWSSGIDAAMSWDNDKVYFFKDNQCMLYNITSKKPESGYPKSTKKEFSGAWDSTIDAALNLGNGKIYFFRGDQYMRLSKQSMSMNSGYPKKIKGNWPGLFENKVTGAINWSDTKVCFFRNLE